MKYPAYPKYKDSGVEWIGEIPEGWATTKIGYVADFASGSTPSKERDDFWSGNIPWVSPKDMKRPWIDGAEDHVTSVAVNELGLRMVDPGALLIVVRGMILVHSFPVGQTTVAVTINQDMKALVLFEVAIPDFIQFYLIGITRQILSFYVDEAAHGTLAIRMGGFKALPVVLPGLAEQLAIASFLTRETSKIDTTIQDYEDLINLLTEKRRALIGHAVTRGLSKLVAADDAEVGVWADPVEYRDSGVEWLGDIPVGWSTPAVCYRYEVQLGKMLDGSRISGDHLYPYLRNTDVQWNSINLHELPEMDFREDDRSKFALKSGDLLVCEGGDVGRAAIWRETAGTYFYQKALHRLRPLKQQSDSPEFFYFFLYVANKSGLFTIGEDKATIFHLPAERLRAQRFPCPPYVEQLAIASFLTRETAKIDTLVSETQDAIALLKEHRSALITAAVTGKINVEAIDG